MRMMLSSTGGVMVVIWLLVTAISVISSLKKKSQAQNGNWPNNQRPPQRWTNQPDMPKPPRDADVYRPEEEINRSAAVPAGSVPMQRAQWDNAKIRQQMSRFQGNLAPQPRSAVDQGKEGAYPDEESYRREEEFQRQSDVFTPLMPAERVEEYVPEEFGEAGGPAEDNFYSSAVIQSGLHDEEDIAREKAYQAGHENAFKQRAKKRSRFSRVLARSNSMKKAILLSEILAAPKALKDRL